MNKKNCLIRFQKKHTIRIAFGDWGQEKKIEKSPSDYQMKTMLMVFVCITLSKAYLTASAKWVDSPVKYLKKNNWKSVHRFINPKKTQWKSKPGQSLCWPIIHLNPQGDATQISKVESFAAVLGST